MNRPTKGDQRTFFHFSVNIHLSHLTKNRDYNSSQKYTVILFGDAYSNHIVTGFRREKTVCFEYTVLFNQGMNVLCGWGYINLGSGIFFPTLVSAALGITTG